MAKHPTSKNITYHYGTVTVRQRQHLLGQRGGVVWLTGLSGSGKSTLASELERRLMACGRLAYVLDGDNIRHGLNVDLGFSHADRMENIRRIGEVAALFADSGLVVIAAFISPYRSARAKARQAAEQRLGPGSFLEVFCDAPLAVCRQRDPKGLYRKAAAGKVTQFTGVSAPYQPPVSPDLTVATDRLTPGECAEAIVALLRRRGRIPRATAALAALAALAAAAAPAARSARRSGR